MPVRGEYNLDPNVLTGFSLDLTPELAPLREFRKVSPVISVPKADFKWQVYQETWYTDESEDIKAPGQEPRFVDYDLSSGSDKAFAHSLAKRIPDEEMRDSDDVLDPIEDAVLFLRFKLLLHLSRIVATAFGTTGNFGSFVTLAGANQWSDFGGSDPLGDVDTAKETIRGLFGMDPSGLTLVVTPPVLTKLRLHPQVRATFGGGYQPIVNPSLQQIADAFGVKEVLVLGGVYNSANPGQTVSMADVFGKHAWLLHLPETVNSRRARVHSALFVVEESEMSQDDDFISWEQIERTTSEGRLTGSRIIKNQMTYKHVILNSKFGYMIENAVA